MLFTTVPALALALILYALLGMRFTGGEMDTGGVNEIMATLETRFTISAWLLLVPGLVFVLVVRRVPALPALLIGAVAGGLCAMFVQGAPLSEVLLVANGGYAASTGVAAVDELLTRGGLASMFSTLAIIITAMCFGGVMERSGMLESIASVILRFARSTGSLIAATIGTCIGMNIIAPDQYLSIVVPGRMYRDAYERAGLDPKNLSRALEDAGTLTSSLVPWNTCGAYMTATLGVFSFAYLPYAFLNLICPVISVIYGYTGFTIVKVKPAAAAEVPAGTATRS
jgi:NhaC family Na+:H+ antiporter